MYRYTLSGGLGFLCLAAAISNLTLMYFSCGAVSTQAGRNKII
jgi:hypothetical protein